MMMSLNIVSAVNAAPSAGTFRLPSLLAFYHHHQRQCAFARQGTLLEEAAGTASAGTSPAGGSATQRGPSGRAALAEARHVSACAPRVSCRTWGENARVGQLAKGVTSWRIAHAA